MFKPNLIKYPRSAIKLFFANCSCEHFPPFEH
jgi:hypothetical protein